MLINQIKVILPTLLFFIVCLAGVFIWNYTNFRTAVLFLGFGYLTILFQLTIDSDVPSVMEITTGKAGEKNNAPTLILIADLIFSWFFALYLTVDILAYSFNAITAVFLLYFTWWGNLALVGLDEDERFTSTLLGSRNLRYITHIFSAFYALVSISAIFFGEWKWSYASLF